MSTRVALSIAALVFVAIGLGYYLRREQPAPPTPGPAPKVQPAPVPVERAPAPPIDPTLSVLNRVENHHGTSGKKIAVIGGEEIPVQVREARRSHTTIDDGKSGGFFEPLAAVARAGDDDAARALYESLRLCKNSPKTRAEFDATWAARAQWFALTGGGVYAPGDKPVDFDQFRKNFEDEFHRCENITNAMYAQATAILRDSAERSDESRLAYAEAIANTDSDEARAHYEVLWQHGWIEGLEWLARDSLPHAVAYTALMSATLPGAGAEKMKAAEAGVSPSAFEQASRDAAQILKNPNCCKF